jgi:3,4-dihydroxy 2-butanone 4-phosphate synthase/GTP cyclohydrolase II
VHSFRSKVSPHSFYIALCKGDLQQSATGDDSVLLRAQRAQIMGDVFGLADDDSASRMRASIRQIERAGRGVFLYVLGHNWPPEPLLQSPATGHAPALKPAEAGFREFGLGAQVLRSLGIHRIRILTNNPRKIVGLSGFGIETLGALPLEEDGGG